MTRRVLLIGAGVLLVQAIAEQLADGATLVTAPAIDDDLARRADRYSFPVPTSKDIRRQLGAYNDVAQLKRQVRAREKRTRKMLPKGRK